MIRTNTITDDNTIQLADNTELLTEIKNNVPRRRKTKRNFTSSLKADLK